MSLLRKGLKVTLRVRQPDELAEVREPDGDLAGYVWVPVADEVFDLSDHVVGFTITPGRFDGRSGDSA